MDEQNVPIEGADLVILYIDPQSPDKHTGLRALTGPDGSFLLEKKIAMQHIQIWARRKDYYEEIRNVKFTGHEDKKWIPYDTEQVLHLAKIINPVPMYAVSWTAEMPQTSPTGFDLEKHDWVTPYGKGAHPDLVLSLENQEDTWGAGHPQAEIPKPGR